MKNKRILIIGRRHAGEKNDSRLLAKGLARKMAANVKSAYYEDAVFSIQRGMTQVVILCDGDKEVLTSFDVIVFINWSHNRLYGDVAHSLAYVANKAGAVVWNEELVTARSSTKISQLVELSYEEVKVPKTVYSLTPDLLQPYTTVVGHPFVAKDPLASRGRNNHLCADWNTFERTLNPENTYLLQELIPNDHSDWRLFMVANVAELVILRSGSIDSHLNNVSAGARAHLVASADLPRDVREEAGRIARHFKRNLCGIDYMQDSRTGDYVFLEINTTPQIINGVFADEKIAAIARMLNRQGSDI